MGREVAAVVQVHAGRSLTPEELIHFVKGRIGSVKAPKQVDIWDDLPRSKVGKVLKKEIRAKNAFRAMKPDGAAGKGGAVVNVASVAATIAFPGIAGDNATKSAVDRLTRVGRRS